jgi:hypothetical protein
VTRWERLVSTLSWSVSAKSLSMEMLRFQLTCGDFFLKLIIAETSASLLKAYFQLTHVFSPWWKAQEDGIRAQIKCLDDIVSSLAILVSQMKELEKQEHCVADGLGILFSSTIQTLESASNTLGQWIASGTTPKEELYHHAGLWRDVPIAETHASDQSSLALRDHVDRSPVLLGLYAAANAYTELQSVDIVSFLALQASDEGHQELVRDLAHQLADEARHARMFSGLAKSLNTPLGALPIRLDAWVAVRKTEHLSERLAIQQVLLEGVGLDSTARSAHRLANSDQQTATDVFVQVMLDEVRHTALGIRWIARLDDRSVNDVLEYVQRFISLDSFRTIPTVPELQLQAGVPDVLVERAARTRGRLPLSAVTEPLENSTKRHDSPYLEVLADGVL